MSDVSGLTPQFIADLADYALLGTSREGKVSFYNKQASCLFGCTLPNHYITDFLSGEELAVLRHNIAIAFSRHIFGDFYWLYNRRVYLVSLHLWHQEVFLCFRDITEIRAQADMLQNCQERFTAIEEMGQIGYWELNLSRRIFYWSAGMYRLLAQNEQHKRYNYDLLRQHIHPDDVDFYRQKRRELLQGDTPVSGNIRLILADGHIKLCHFYAAKTDNNGEINASGILQDITQLCPSDSFITSAELGHDVKQHLQPIRLCADSLLQCRDDEISRYVGQINRQLDKLCSLLSTEADMAKFCNVSSATCFNVAELLEEICGDINIIATTKNIKLLTRFKSVWLHSDKRLFAQIVRNLLDNALKFASGKIILGNSASGLWIIDDGCGISDNQQAQIFQCFYSTDKQQGWGLGLFMVKKAADKLQLKISLKSRPEKYTIFRLRWSQEDINCR